MNPQTMKDAPDTCVRCGGDLSMQDWDTCPECRAFEDALAYLDFEIVETGGGVTALRHEHREDAATYITVEGEAPTRLADGPVDVGFYEHGAPGQTRRFPTLADALLDMFGPSEGDPLPEPLRTCREITDTQQEVNSGR